MRGFAAVAVAAALVGTTLSLAGTPDQPSAAAASRSFKLGESVQGRAIRATQLGDPDAERKVLVLGSLHGDERAGISVARALADGAGVEGTDLWIVKNLNPDGAAAGTRQNARGVDLNRNFSHRWRRNGQPFDRQYSGPRALSEPESRIARDLIVRLRPAITIWFHQPLAMVDLSGGDGRIERRFGRLTGLPVRRLPRYRGSATSWQNTRLTETTAFVTELRGGRLKTSDAERYARAIRALIRQTD